MFKYSGYADLCVVDMSEDENSLRKTMEKATLIVSVALFVDGLNLAYFSLDPSSRIVGIVVALASLILATLSIHIIEELTD